MKKKIAILTQPLGLNYGGIIQNYALQKVLCDMNYEVVTVNRTYNNTLTSIQQQWLDFKITIHHSLYRTQKLPETNGNRERIKRYTNQFIRRNISITKTLDTNEKIARFGEENHFHAYVIGSDQTWRPRYSPNIYNFYLDFLASDTECRRVAYASSFGTDDWEYTPQQTEKCLALIQRFDAVSVREDSGVALCETYLQSKPQLVLDPTLLLTEQDYNTLLSNVPERKGLFSYVLDQHNDKQDIIRYCQNALGLPEFKNQALKSIHNSDSKNIEEYIMPPLEGWLSGFRDADFVVTDSFHGTVFSIIYSKPFIAIANTQRGASRFTSLLKQLGLESRLIFSQEELTDDLLHSSIDYETVHDRLNALKSQSIHFLKTSLE